MDLSGFQLAMAVAGALVVSGWLVVSFLRPGRVRGIIAWVATCGLYGVLFSLFASLSTEAWREGNRVALVAFGLLLALFGTGLTVSLVRTIGALRASRAAASDVIR